MKDGERQRLVANIAGSLAQVSRKEIIERSIAHFAAADQEYGQRIAEAVRSHGNAARSPSSIAPPL